jgi:hypothetical protein
MLHVGLASHVYYHIQCMQYTMALDRLIGFLVSWYHAMLFDHLLDANTNRGSLVRLAS